MKQFFCASKNGVLSEAVRGLQSPKLIILMSNPDQFEEHVAELERLYPNIPSIGVVDMCYDTQITEKGVGIVAYTEGVEAVANVIEQVSVMPVKYIRRVEKAVEQIRPSSSDTVCIDFCTGNDACVLTTIYSYLGARRIKLMGGTGDAGKVSCNGKVYSDACAFALIKNLNGKVEVYKENIYAPMPENYRLIASKTNRSKYYIGELNNKPAKQVYMDILNIRESDITSQTFKNPLGKLNGDDICIVSLKAVEGNGLLCFRQVNDSDVLTILEIQDYKSVAEQTIIKINNDFRHISAVFSVNCLFRYLYFGQNNAMNDYLKTMSQLNNHCGFIGYGEHCNSQFVNQSMTCVVFE